MTVPLESSSARGRTSVGLRPRWRGQPVIFGEGRIEIGNDVTIASVPVRSHFHAAQGAILRIGDGVMIGHGAAIAAVSSVTIEGGARIGPFASIGDTDFHTVGDRYTAPTPRPVVIGARARLGARVTILPGANVGEEAIVEAGSTVGGVVKRGSHVSGVPARPVGPTDVDAPREVAQTTREVVGAGPDMIALVVMNAFGLLDPPSLNATPADIVEWDSLGMLRLLVSLEERFGIRLIESDIARVTRVSDLVAVVHAARRRGVAG